jgi:tryptophan synthase alpha chain
MISRISRTFNQLRKEGKKAFIPYIMAGDPSLEMTRDIVLLFEKCGADIVELGVPFSDPLADGPTIQQAAERARMNGVTLREVIEFVREIRRETDIPLILMTYYNPVFIYGLENFVRNAVEAGVDGVIIPDLPPEEGTDLLRISRENPLDIIFLLAPTSTIKRIKTVAKKAGGFIYYVSVTGITGGHLMLDGSIEDSIRRIRQQTTKPVAVGFGISTPEEAAEVARISDGVIVGSAIIKQLHNSYKNLDVYLTSLREAIK